MRKEDENISKWELPVEVICYYTLIKFETRNQAKQFYMRAMNMCEGSEKERYVNIFTALLTTDDKMVHDDVDEEPMIYEIGKYIGEKYEIIEKLDCFTKYSDYLESQKEESSQCSMGMSY